MNLLKTHNITSLSIRKEISEILNHGKKIYINKVGIFFLSNDENDSYLKTAILLKKSVGSAVKRNYIKRIYRHFIRENFTLLKRFNRVIFLYRGESDISFNEFSQLLKQALVQI